MQKPDSFRIQLEQKLSRVTSSQVIGASGLAVLCAASALALAPASEQAPVTALVQWVGGLGLNILAGVLQQSYRDLLSKPSHDEQEQLTRLAKLLTRDIRRQAELRREIGAFLGEGNLDAFRIAQEVVEGNPAVHGWLLVQIFQDVSQYRGDFDQIHITLAEMKRLIERMQQPLEVSAPDAQVKFSYKLIHIDSALDEHLYVLRAILENTGSQVIDNLKLEFTFPDFDSVPRKWEIVGFLGETPSEAVREASSPLVEVNPEGDTVSVRRGQYVIQVTYRSRDKVFPGEKVDLTEAVGLRFRIDRSVYANLDDMPSLNWTLYADDMPRKQGEVPISQLNDY
jgi:hypothetical protein